MRIKHDLNQPPSMMREEALESIRTSTGENGNMLFAHDMDMDASYIANALWGLTEHPQGEKVLLGSGSYIMYFRDDDKRNHYLAFDMADRPVFHSTEYSEAEDWLAIEVAKESMRPPPHCWQGQGNSGVLMGEGTARKHFDRAVAAALARYQIRAYSIDLVHGGDYPFFGYEFSLKIPFEIYLTIRRGKEVVVDGFRISAYGTDKSFRFLWAHMNGCPPPTLNHKTGVWEIEGEPGDD